MKLSRRTSTTALLGVLALSTHSCSATELDATPRWSSTNTSGSGGSRSSDAGSSSTGSSSGTTSSGGDPPRCAVITPGTWLHEGTRTDDRLAFLAPFAAEEYSDTRFYFEVDVDVPTDERIDLKGERVFASAYGRLGGVHTLLLPEEGTVTVRSVDDATRSIDAVFNDVRFVEVDREHEPVSNGKCAVLTTAHVVVTNPPVPDAWACSPASFYDPTCDCGCGVPDPRCDNATAVAACESCLACGQRYANESCSGLVDPSDPTRCRR